MGQVPTIPLCRHYLLYSSHVPLTWPILSLKGGGGGLPAGHALPGFCLCLLLCLSRDLVCAVLPAIPVNYGYAILYATVLHFLLYLLLAICCHSVSATCRASPPHILYTRLPHAVTMRCHHSHHNACHVLLRPVLHLVLTQRLSSAPLPFSTTLPNVTA